MFSPRRADHRADHASRGRPPSTRPLAAWRGPSCPWPRGTAKRPRSPQAVPVSLYMHTCRETGQHATACGRKAAVSTYRGPRRWRALAQAALRHKRAARAASRGHYPACFSPAPHPAQVTWPRNPPSRPARGAAPLSLPTQLSRAARRARGALSWAPPLNARRWSGGIRHRGGLQHHSAGSALHEDECSGLSGRSRCDRYPARTAEQACSCTLFALLSPNLTQWG